MKTIFFITGTSRGIGKSIAELALNENYTLVYGFSRSQTIDHPNYIHTSIDLSNTEDLLSLDLPSIDDAQKVVLINNSGMLGQVNSVGKLSTQTIINTHTLNAIAPIVLSNILLQKYNSKSVEKVIINISSGAARSPVKSWANYCSSKASVDMQSQVIQLENEDTSVRVFSIALGIVDTQMQNEIRSTSQETFPDIDKFIDYKNRKLLTSTDQVAESILRIAKHPEKFQDVLLDVRKL